MKTASKITIGLATAALLFVGCVNTVMPSTVTEEQLGYRNTSLSDENSTVLPEAKYGDAAPGTSTKIARAFQDAPPMIPHDTEGMLPIQKDNNQCLSCHMPEVAESMGATPIPTTHFLNMRPVGQIVNDEFVQPADVLKNEVKIQKGKEIYAGRFNCSQCHAPQSNAKLITENRFQAEYTSKDGAFKSNWINEVVNDLDTVGKDSVVTDNDIHDHNSEAGEPVFKH